MAATSVPLVEDCDGFVIRKIETTGQDRSLSGDFGGEKCRTPIKALPAVNIYTRLALTTTRPTSKRRKLFL